MIEKNLYITGDYLKLNPDWHAGVSPIKARQILCLLTRAGITPQTIGEIGCGVGEILAQLQTQMDPSCTLWGYDIAPSAIARAKIKENDRLHFFLTDFPPQEQFFDLLLLIDMIEHVEDYIGLVRRVHAKTTYLMIQFSLDLTVGALLHSRTLLGFRSTHGHVGHWHYFTKNIALAMLEDLDYEILAAVYTPDPVPATDFVGKLVSIVRKGLYLLNKDVAVRFLGGYKLLVLAKTA